MIIEVDENNIHDVILAIKKLHKIRTTLLRTNPSAMISNVRWEKRLASIEKEYKYAKAIFEVPLNNEIGEFYVYAHCDPLKAFNVKDIPQHLFAAADLKLSHPPFYIGKGTGDRAYDLTRNEGHRKIRTRLKKAGKEVEVVILKTGLSEKAALLEEGRLIDIFGLRLLKENALLVNHDEGQFVDERRNKYPKGAGWYLNRIGIKPHSVPKG